MSSTLGTHRHRLRTMTINYKLPSLASFCRLAKTSSLAALNRASTSLDAAAT